MIVKDDTDTDGREAVCTPPYFDVHHPEAGSHALTGQAVVLGVLGLFLCPFSLEGRWPDLGLMPGIPRRPPGLAFPSRLSIRRCNWAMVYCCWAMTANKTSEGQIEDCIHAVCLP